MKKKYTHILYILLSLSLMGCRPEAGTEPAGNDKMTIQVLDSLETFSSEGGIKRLRITSRKTWTTETSEPWISLYPDRGAAGELDLDVRADENPYCISRKGEIQFHTGDTTILAKVLQLHKEGIVFALPRYTCYHQGGQFSLAFQNGKSFTCTTSCDWIVPEQSTPIEGKGCDSLRITIRRHEGDATRTGLLVLKSEDGETCQEIEFIQKGVRTWKIFFVHNNQRVQSPETDHEVMVRWGDGNEIANKSSSIVHQYEGQPPYKVEMETLTKFGTFHFENLEGIEELDLRQF